MSESVRKDLRSPLIGTEGKSPTHHPNARNVVADSSGGHESLIRPPEGSAARGVTFDERGREAAAASSGCFGRGYKQEIIDGRLQQRPVRVWVSFAAFFLCAWMIASLSILPSTNLPLQPQTELLIKLFLILHFAMQGIGALLFGFAADYYGRKKALLACFVVMCAGSAGCFVLTGQVNIAAMQLHPAQASVLPSWVWSLLIFLVGTLLSFGCCGLYPVVGTFAIESMVASVHDGDEEDEEEEREHEHSQEDAEEGERERSRERLRRGSNFEGTGQIQPDVLGLGGRRGKGREKLAVYPGRHVQVACLFCMQGLAHILVRLTVVIAFRYVPSMTRGLAWRILVVVPVVPSIILFFITLIACREPEVYKLHRTRQHFCGFLRTTCRYGRRTMRAILGVTLPWALFDFTFYGNGVFHFLLVHQIRGYDSAWQQNLTSLVVVSVSFVGYVLAIFLISAMAPKQLQLVGFVVLAFVFYGLALSLYSISSYSSHKIRDYVGASLLYDSVFRFFNFPPNLTTYLIPLECFHTQVRGTFHGIATAAARVGALLGLVFSWALLEQSTRSLNLLICCLTAILGTLCTMIYTPHVKPVQEELMTLDAKYAVFLTPESQPQSIRTPIHPRHVGPAADIRGARRSRVGVEW
ncbi:unnamed protein product [Vitrella brassicaformis CCMP3155]|uniref:Major facilitator superfamily (MFS) profile domain-containing protein n=3 Tax=Vitrella brassicaformis TaxID=1169539 RepID=A0A0G4GC30_VITBC|nr:unnamed protein product [Vitrella brassicaformis CCMP3155]|eukprot:CEM26523.1 unnamed protein product [Vitrella brassicaformis CCMP3155]